MILQPKQIDKNVSWLLANGSAPIKYLTHKHLLKTPFTSKTMRDLWRNVEASPCVQEIFSKQEDNGAWYAGGSWANKPSYAVKGGIDPYRPKYVTTAWILPLLGEMGYSACDKRIRKACRFVISNGYYQDPLFDKGIDEIRESAIDLSPCRFAQYMIALGSVGFNEDERVDKGYEVLLSMQRDDGGWVFPKHSDQMGWTRSCLFSTYHAVMALYCSKNPAYKDALVRGIEFMLWHLSTKKDCDLQQFYYHGHSMVRELVMFSDLGIGLHTRTVKAILNWLMTLYNVQEGCFQYTGKPVSKYSRKKDGIDAAVAKYRFYHVIESDWLTYHVTTIAANMLKHDTGKEAGV